MTGRSNLASRRRRLPGFSENAQPTTELNVVNGNQVACLTTLPSVSVSVLEHLVPTQGVYLPRLAAKHSKENDLRAALQNPARTVDEIVAEETTENSRFQQPACVTV
jgi:hypothetical protein